MAIFWNYIKGTEGDWMETKEDGNSIKHEGGTTITKIFFPPTENSIEYPTIKLFNKDNILKQDLGEIITTEGSEQKINKQLTINKLKFFNIEGTTSHSMIKTEGDFMIGPDYFDWKNLIINNSIEANKIEANNGIITNLEIKTQLKVGENIVLDSKGSLIINNILFI